MVIVYTRCFRLGYIADEPFTLTSMMATYSESDHQYALSYAVERVRQEPIFRLKMEEPSTYAFINIDVIDDGWHKMAGITTELGQKLAPYRKISYDTSNLDCSAFSCIPVDMLKRPQGDDGNRNTHASFCNFAEHTSISFPVMDREGNIIRRFTACGPGCYKRNKRRDPHTGLPSANGLLLDDYVDPETGEKMCQHINQSLVMWAAIPWTRPGKEVEGYNTVHVPGFGFEEDAGGGYTKFNNVKISERYCNFFKQYLNEESGECYRSGWMKFVKFMFGQYTTNLSYELANPSPDALGTGFNCWQYALGRALYKAGAPPETSEIDDIMLKEPMNFSSVIHEPKQMMTSGNIRRKDAQDIIHTRHLGDKIIDTDRAISWLESTSQSEDIDGFSKSGKLMMETSDAIIDAAMQLELLGLSDKQARRALLKELLKGSRKSAADGGFADVASFSQTIRLVGLTLAIRKSLFSKEAISRRKRNAVGNEEPAMPTARWSASAITERDALLVAKANLEASEQRSGEYKRPAPFLDVIPVKNFGEDKTTSASDIWLSLVKKYASVLQHRVTSGLKSMVVSTVRQFLDIMEGKIFQHGNDWENNVPLMIGVDAILRKIMVTAARLCTRMAASLSSKAATYSSDVVASMSSEVATDVASRVFGVLLEETVVRMVVSAALRTAMQAFVALAELAASAITVMGVVIMVVSVIGILLDLALGLSWYDTVLTPDSVEKVIRAYQTAFANATNTDYGQTSPVTAEELVGIDVELQIEEQDKIRTERGGGEDELEGYMDRAFKETPLLPKSRAVFLQDSAYEYLAGRTMNSLGQRLIVSASGPQGDHGLINEARSIITETAQSVENYSKVVDYNASRLDCISKDWTCSEASCDTAVKSDALFRESVTFAAAAGFSLTIGLGVLFATHVCFVRGANIGLSVAFIGLLAFMTLAGIAFLNLNAMGEANADAIRSMDIGGNKGSIYQSDRVGALQRMTGVGAKYNVIYDFVNPFLEQLQ